MKCNDSFIKILFCVFLVIFFPSVNSEDKNGYLIMDFKDFVKSRTVVEFRSKDYGNFDQLMNFHYTFVVSNGSELLKLDEDRLNLLEKFSSNKCTEGACTAGKIKTLKNKSNYLWFCIVTKFISKDAEYIQDPSCRLHDKKSIRKNPIANWGGISYGSSDFQHESVTLELDINVYTGYYSRSTKNLHIAYNEIPFMSRTITDNHIAHLPKFYFKGDGAFLSGFLNDKSVYFVYHEADKTCGSQDTDKSLAQTRIVELCQNDRGTTSQKLFVWSAKIDLECYWKKNTDINRHIPLSVMRQASDSVWLKNEKILLVSFIDKGSAEPSSAVCAYTIDQIREAFNSDMKKDDPKPTYLSNKYKDICSRSDINALSEKDKSQIQTLSTLYPRRKKILSAISLYSKSGGRITKLYADEMPSHSRVNIFLGMSERSLHSLVILKKSKDKICVEKKVFMEDEITMLQKAKTSNKVPNLYIGTKKRLIKLTLNNCGRYSQKTDCLQDIYCGWRNNIICVNLLLTDSVGIDTGQGRCSRSSVVPSGAGSNDALIWTKCDMLKNHNMPTKNRLGTCQCQVNSLGTVFKIGSCNVNGDWSPFSAWSNCEPSCGKGTQFKLRSCTFPKVQGDGKSCDPALAIETRTCMNKEECKSKDSFDTPLKLSPWSKWSSCDRTCGFSYKQRTRKCLIPTPCKEDLIQKKLCNNTKFCIDTQVSEWSDWTMKVNQRSRKRFNCTKKFLLFTSKIKLQLINTPTKPEQCDQNLGNCEQKYSDSFVKSTFDSWSQWSNCSKKCGKSSHSIRQRTCRQFSLHSCVGSNYEIKLCESLPCKSRWACWSNWTPCPTKCETPGVQKRQRDCVLDKEKRACLGRSIQQKECQLKECASLYTQWSRWSSCLRDGYMKRERRCRGGSTSRKCLMPLIQTKPCNSIYNQVVVKYSSMYMVVSSLVGLIVGGILGISIGYIWFKCTVSVLQKSESMRLSTNAQYYRQGDPVDQNSITYGSQYLHMLPVSTTPRQRSYTGSSPARGTPNTDPNGLEEPTYNNDSQISDPSQYHTSPGFLTSPPSTSPPAAYFVYPTMAHYDPQQGLYHVPPRSTSYQQPPHPTLPEEEDNLLTSN